MYTSSGTPPTPPNNSNEPQNFFSSEANYFPLPEGKYLITLSGRDVSAYKFGGIDFPCLQAAVLPGDSRGIFTQPEKQSSVWLHRVGDKALLEVYKPGAYLVVTTYRPLDYPTTGLRISTQRLQNSVPESSTAPHEASDQPHAFPNYTAKQPIQPVANAQYHYSGSQQSIPQHFGLRFSDTQSHPFNFNAFQSPNQPDATEFTVTANQQIFFKPEVHNFQQINNATSNIHNQATSSSAMHNNLLKSCDVSLAAHIQNMGDRKSGPGEWAGKPGSRLRIEAIALDPQGILPNELEYATVSIDGRLSPWTTPPQFSGSKGRALPLIGFAARLTGHAASSYDVIYCGSFIQAGEVAEIKNGDFLRSIYPTDPLEAIRIRIVSKSF